VVCPELGIDPIGQLLAPGIDPIGQLLAPGIDPFVRGLVAEHSHRVVAECRGPDPIHWDQ